MSAVRLVSGIGASSGVAIGPVCIVGETTLPESFPDGAILVAYTTNPRLVRLMLKASAIVTEIGGRLCHSAIVALELGIPCVVGAGSACSILRDGMQVCVDGDMGTVSAIEPS